MKIAKILLVALCFIFVLSSCYVQKNDDNKNSKTTTQSSPTSSGSINLDEKDLKEEKIDGFKIEIPDYSKKTVLQDRYKNNNYIYELKGNQLLCGVSQYKNKKNNPYPNKTINSGYNEKDSSCAIADFSVCSAITNYYKIPEELSVGQSVSIYEDILKIKNTYKYTGYVYTNFFDNSKKDTYIYFYSYILNNDKNAVVIWVADLTASHKYQTESATILNNIMVKKYK